MHLNERLQGMLLRLFKYDFEVVYQPGKTIVIADMLSRAYLPHEEGAAEFDNINMAKFLPKSDKRLEQFHRETAADETLQKMSPIFLSAGMARREG